MVSSTSTLIKPDLPSAPQLDLNSRGKEVTNSMPMLTLPVLKALTGKPPKV
jgi:hypothetical protein